MVENTDPIVFYLYNAFNSEEVRQLLIDKFRSSGHCRRIDFIDWDCLNEKPPRGGDLYIFDSVVLSHMCANSYIRKMPEIIDKEGIFQWALDTTKYKNANYGVPLMLCADVIISTRQKDKGTANIFELDGKVDLRLALHQAKDSAQGVTAKGIHCLELTAQGYSSQEIAAIVHAEAATVRMWMTKARRYLRSIPELRQYAYSEVAG